MKFATQPVRSRPSSKNSNPTSIVIAIVRLMKSDEPAVATTPITLYEISAVAESGPTLSVRDVPKQA